jgi:hypothetical protein
MCSSSPHEVDPVPATLGSPARRVAYEVAKKRVGCDQVAAVVPAAITVAEAPVTAVAAAGAKATERSLPSVAP